MPDKKGVMLMKDIIKRIAGFLVIAAVVITSSAMSLGTRFELDPGDDEVRPENILPFRFGRD